MRKNIDQFSRVLKCIRLARLGRVAGIALALAFAALPVRAEAELLARLEASRLSGPAPLAVLFDATHSTGGGLPFHELVYSFDFGDDRAGNWSVSKLPKNKQSGGALAAHVFDRPGNYLVHLRVTGKDGRESEASLQVTVLDPNVVYSGSQTVCVSPSKNFVGCPDGAAKRSSLPNSFNSKRILLRRGESFPALGLEPDHKGFQIGAFGEGVKPKIEGLSSGMREGLTSWASDFTVMDLDVGAGAVSIDATVSRFLLYRNDIKTPGMAEAMVNVGSALPYYQEHGASAVRRALYWPREVFLVENDIQGAVNAQGRPNLVIMGYFAQSAILGNVIDKAAQHSLRVWAANKLVVSHNAIGGNHYAPNPPGIRGAIKIHSAGTQKFAPTLADSLRPATSQVIVSNNIIGSKTYPGSFLSGFSPQNADSGTVEGLEDCIAENNVYVRGRYTVSDMQLRGRRITVRGNTVQGGGAANISRAGYAYDAKLSDWDGPYFIQ